MRSSTFVIAFLGCLLLFFLTSATFADDGIWGSQADPCVFSTIEGEEDFLHYDADPFKGYATIWFLNGCNEDEDWGDFHLKVIGKDSNNVDFVIGGEFNPEIWVYTVGVGLEQITDLNPKVSPDGGQLDLYFYDNPIANLSIGYIKVYTDNTSHCSYFNIKAYPTLVPEPTTVALLGLGALAILRKRR